MSRTNDVQIVGFYGGKFIPFHKGHLYCAEKACQICDRVHLILFDSPCNRILEHGTEIDRYLSVEWRMEQLYRVKGILSESYPDTEILIHCIKTDGCIRDDGSEDWDKETPLVIEAIGGHFDYVFSSEPSYDDYFRRAYPFAKHILVDPMRSINHISATEIRIGGKDVYDRWAI